jgi:uncharacterized membrane protein YqjE
MPTRVAETNGTGMATATKQVADHAVAIAKLELKLALLELKEKVAALGLGAGLLVGAAVFALSRSGSRSLLRPRPSRRRCRHGSRS